MLARRYAESSPASETEPDRRRHDLEDLEVANALWRLRFYCWRRTLVLSVATVAALDGILAVVDGRQPHALDMITTIVKDLEPLIYFPRKYGSGGMV
jgi:hypothetical protein